MEKLSADTLRREQVRTLEAPRMAYGLLARVLFLGMDLFYGRRRTLSKFKVLELIARVPYQAWEQVGYVAMTHTARDPGDHAEHEYMEFVRDHPNLERQPFDSV